MEYNEDFTFPIAPIHGLQVLESYVVDLSVQLNELKLF